MIPIIFFALLSSFLLTTDILKDTVYEFKSKDGKRSMVTYKFINDIMVRIRDIDSGLRANIPWVIFSENSDRSNRRVIVLEWYPVLMFSAMLLLALIPIVHYAWKQIRLRSVQKAIAQER